MKRVLAILLTFLLLSGCNQKNLEMELALSARKKLTDSDGCQFTASITADYGDKLYQFQMECRFDDSGNMFFTVIEPSSIYGITGKIENKKGMLTFDDCVLAFDLLADGLITPVSGPWVLVKTLRGGYISSCYADEQNMQMTIHDSYEEDALQLDIWTDLNGVPSRAEIIFQGKRILTIEVINFSYL